MIVSDPDPTCQVIPDPDQVIGKKFWIRADPDPQHSCLSVIRKQKKLAFLDDKRRMRSL